MNPTICKACGGRIEKPDGRHVCERCDFVIRATGEIPPRSDDSDLTHKLAIGVARRDAWRECKHERMATIAFWIIVLSGNAILAYWLGKQAGLWN